jgi:hypothetical protein
MIRRAFWLGAGAAAGIMGYRRVSALGRRFSLTGTRRADTRRADGRKPGPRKERHAVRDTIKFAGDVREGMDIYQSRHALPSGNALPAGNRSAQDRSVRDSSATDRHDRKDGR